MSTGIERAAHIVLFIVERRLFCRGSYEKFGSKHDGNFMKLLELISKFDQTLFQHVEKYGNQGTGKASYFSQSTCEEFLSLFSKKPLPKSSMRLMSQVIFRRCRFNPEYIAL